MPRSGEGTKALIPRPGAQIIAAFPESPENNLCPEIDRLEKERDSFQIQIALAVKSPRKAFSDMVTPGHTHGKETG